MSRNFFKTSFFSKVLLDTREIETKRRPNILKKLICAVGSGIVAIVCLTAPSALALDDNVVLLETRDIGDAILESTVRIARASSAATCQTPGNDPFEKGVNFSSFTTSGASGTIGSMPPDIVVGNAPKSGERLTNLVFKQARQSIKKIKNDLKLIHAPRGLTMCTSETNELHRSANELGQRAFDTNISAAELSRVDLFDIYSQKTSSVLQRKLWGRVFYLQTQKQFRERSFSDAARASFSPAMKHYYWGCEQLSRQQWDSAWKSFMKVRRLQPDNFEMTNMVADAYRQLTTRDAELSYWLDHSLELAPTWAVFSPLYHERAKLSLKYGAAAAKKDHQIDVHWRESQMPLTVYFKGENGADFDQRLISTLMQAFDDWRKASEYKFTIKQVNSPKQARIIVEWGTHPKEKLLTLKTISDALLNLTQETGGVTRNVISKTRITSSHITIYSIGVGPNKLLNDDQLYAVGLHETGHALGMQKHGLNQTDVMGWRMDPDEPLHGISDEDRKRIKLLYKELAQVNAPVKNLSAESATPPIAVPTPEPPHTHTALGRSLRTRYFDFYRNEKDGLF
jgi:predicted Zn-dependent protease